MHTAIGPGPITPLPLDPNLALLDGIYSFHATGAFPTLSPGYGPNPNWFVPGKTLVSGDPTPPGVWNYIPPRHMAVVGVLRFDGRGTIYGWGVINHDGSIEMPLPATPPLNEANGSYTVEYVYGPKPYSGEVQLTLRAPADPNRPPRPPTQVTFKFVMADNSKELYMVQINPSFKPFIGLPTGIFNNGAMVPPIPSIGGTLVLIAKKI